MPCIVGSGGGGCAPSRSASISAMRCLSSWIWFQKYGATLVSVSSSNVRDERVGVVETGAASHRGDTARGTGRR